MSETLRDPQNEIRHGQPAIIIAPMEGVTDAPMRALLTEIGGFTHCVSEFLRISQEIPPVRIFRDHVPELNSAGKTPSGIPVAVQILGGDPAKMAAAAVIAQKLGAPSIDINFGCPAPTVNRNDGGATLLKYPERIRSIVEAVRQAVPRETPVSAKLRLGWDDMKAIHHNAEMAAQGGADWITIHGRTRIQGYTPPAYWLPIGEVKKRLKIPVVANGEIWTVDDFKRCRDETQCEHYMLGRTAMADPLLAYRVGVELGLWSREQMQERLPRHLMNWLPLLRRFAELGHDSVPRSRGRPGYLPGRFKQWARMVNQRFPLAWYDSFKRLETLEEMFSLLATHPTEIS